MRTIKAYDEKELRPSTRIAALVAGIALIIMGIFTTMKYSLLVGILLLLAIGLDKGVYVTEEGIEIEYNLFMLKYVDKKWGFDTISNIHKQVVPDKRFYVLHFMQGVMSRRVVLYKEDAEQAIVLALAKNSSIHLDDVDND